MINCGRKLGIGCPSHCIGCSDSPRLIIMLIISKNSAQSKVANCITENVTMRRIVASGKMLLSDRRKSQSEEQHDEPEQPARVVRSSATTVLESRESGKAEDIG